MFGEPSSKFTIEFENTGKLCAGAQLKGRLLFNVQKEKSAELLTMRFYGIEQTRVRKDQKKYATEEAIIFESIAVLDTYPGGTVRPNHYMYFFDFAIPPHVHGSQKYGSLGERFEISYHCEAVLHRRGMLTWNIKNSNVVKIFDEPHFSAPTAMFLGPVIVEATNIFGSKNGSVLTFGAEVNSSFLSPNKALRVHYAICNASTSHVKELDVYLKQIICFSARGFTTLYVNKIVYKRAKLGAHPAESLGEGDRNYHYNALLQRIRDRTFGLDIPVGDLELSTFMGKITSVKYELWMKVKTSFGTANTKIKIPIIVSRNDSIYNPIYFGGEENRSLKQIAIAEGKIEEGKIDEIPPDSDAKNSGSVSLPVLTSELDLSTSLDEYDTVKSLVKILKTCDYVEEINVLRDWLAHSPTNINLLTPDTLYPVYQCLKGNHSFFTFTRILGEAMSKSLNECTCRHIAFAAKGATLGSKNAVWNTFAPYCIDRQNARESFTISELEIHEIRMTMPHYR